MPVHMSSERPQKRTKLLSDDEESDAAPEKPTFTINAEYARRFEHNKQREDRHRLEEKYGKADADSANDDESTDESEDDDAEFATADVDAEIMETLNAIRNKDPRVYDQNSKFYKAFDAELDSKQAKQEKPMYLQDYHRQNLLNGHAGEDEDDEASNVPMTYQQEQDAMKRDLVGSMHAANANDSDDDGEDLLVAKSKPTRAELLAASNAPTLRITDADISTADKDPEKYLSNFMAARAWLPNDGESNSRFQPFESDDSEDDARADAFEEAYNMRFENPETANEKLQSFARDVGKYGVRREEKSARAKAREREREKKEAVRKERNEDKARLRKMKVEEAENKVRRIKEAAGLKGQAIDLSEWRDVLDDEFDDGKWEQEMQRRFGEAYYADRDDGDLGSDDEKNEGAASIKHKPKKPKWDDDIDIQDLVPDFDEEKKPTINLTDDEDGGVALDGDAVSGDEMDVDRDQAPAKQSKAQRAKAATEAKRMARKERREIESLVDASLPLSHPTLAAPSASSRVPVVGFRYRETSPSTFGLSARDILFADDTQLNQFAGLKKLAAFRDDDRKARDRKKYSKKQRLRQWRKETFGDGEAPDGGFERVLKNEPANEKVKKRKAGVDASEGAEGDGKRKKKQRSKTAKANPNTA